MKSLSLLPALGTLETQFRNLPNYTDDLHSFLMPGWMLPGFAFMRPKSPATVSAIYVVNQAGATVAEIDPGQIRCYTTGSVDYFKFSSRQTYNNGLDGDTILDNSTYLKHKPFELPCGVYYYQLHFTDGSDVYSDVWKAVEVNAIPGETELIFNGEFQQGLFGWSTTGTWAADATNKLAINSSNSGSGTVLQQSISGYDTGDKRFKITFTVANMSGTGAGNGLIIQVYDDAGSADYDQELRVSAPGTYTFYASKLNVLSIITEGITALRIGPITIREVVGVEDYVLLQTYNTCRALNSLNTGDADYLEFFMLDARILELQYGQNLQQAENGDGQQINTFARAIQTMKLSALLLPEFAVTYLNTLNTYDKVCIYDGIKHLAYAYDVAVNEEDPTTFEITEFKLTNEWQPSSIYGLAVLEFNCTIDKSDSCCGDIEVAECMDPSDYAFSLEVLNQGDPVVIIQQAMAGPIANSGNLWAELFVAIIENGEFTTCNIPLTAYESAGVVSAQEFATIGISYQMPEDAVGNTFCFFIKLYQIGCADTYSTPKVSYVPE